jgi:arabinogalactan endo-1,4-beta-galactosidase
MHFGDTWNSVGKQYPPAAWASMSYSQMLTAMNNYVYHAMNVIKTRNVSPTWITIGNETNSGICHPVGTISKPAQMTGLLNAAYDMSKTVFPSALVGVHLAQPQNLASVQNFLDKYKANGGKWDFTGLSSYASGSNVATVVNSFKTIKSQCGKPVFHVEAGGPVSKAASTRDSLKAFITAEKSYGCMGILYWEPAGYAPFCTYDMVAWVASTRRPAVSLDAFTQA